MPSTCAVVNCGNRHDRDRKSFFRLPAILSKGDDYKKSLSLLRRKKWIACIRRADLNENKLNWTRVCEDHFITGRPADILDINSPDWAPSVKMGYTTTSKTIGVVIPRHEYAHDKKVSTGTKTFDGHSARNSVIDNPDSVPSTNLNCLEKPQNSSYISPHIEYIKKSIVSQNKSNETAYRNQSSLRTGIKEGITDKDSNVSEVTESSTMFDYENTFLEKNTEEIHLPEKIDSNEEIEPEEFFVHRNIASYKNVENEGIISDEENNLPEFVNSDSLLNQNMLSKKVQTDLTMIEVDKISNALKKRVNEVNELKAKLKSLTENILQLNEIYCQ